MKPLAFVALLTLVNASPEIRYFQYQRPIQNLPRTSIQACLPLETAIFAKAAPNLTDLRLYADTTETPYIVRVAPSANIVPDFQTSISPLNLGQQNGQTTFDAELPKGKYSDIQLNLGSQNFIATVAVSGSQAQSGGAATKLGSYTVFDLTSQKLGRSTILHLPESNFPYLHFQISSPIKPENITGLSINRLTEVEPRFTQVAESAVSSVQVPQSGHTSLIKFTVPANVPIDQVAFAPGTQPVNFSRNIQVSITPAGQPNAAPPQSVNTYGNLLRIHTTQNGHRIDEEHLSIDVANTSFTTPSQVLITIENGDDAPLKLNSVQLRMLQRNLCFEATPNTSYTLFYGDSALSAPQYDYASLFTPQADAIQLSAGSESANHQYEPRVDSRPFTEKHPALLWIALVAVVALLGAIALRSAKPLKT